MTAPLPPERVAELAEALVELLPCIQPEANICTPGNHSEVCRKARADEASGCTNVLASLIARWLAESAPLTPSQAVVDVGPRGLLAVAYGLRHWADESPLSDHVGYDLAHQLEQADRAALVPGHDHEGDK